MAFSQSRSQGFNPESDLGVDGNGRRHSRSNSLVEEAQLFKRLFRRHCSANQFTRSPTFVPPKLSRNLFPLVTNDTRRVIIRRATSAWRMMRCCGASAQTNSTFIGSSESLPMRAAVLAEVLDGVTGESRYPIQQIRPRSGTKGWMLDASAAAWVLAMPGRTY